MSATLASIATYMETAAGASTSANPNESGYWKRIAAASETLAGAGTTANANLHGYMKRTAVALESIAGTDGSAENPNESGYKKRIVDALEVQAGAVTVGSLDYRMMVGAENALWIELGALSLDDLTIAEDQPTDTKVGTITGASGGSTVTLHTQSNAGMFAKDGNDIEVGATPLDFETVPTPTITLRETNALATNSPRDTVIEITVTDVAEGSSNIYPDPELANAADYDPDGDTAVLPGVISFTGLNNEGFDRCSIIGATAAALDAVISDDTVYMCSFNIANFVTNNDVKFKLKAGTSVSILATLEGWTIPVAVTSGVTPGAGASGWSEVDNGGSQFDIVGVEIIPA